MNSVKSEPDKQSVKIGSSRSHRAEEENSLLQQFPLDFSNHIFISLFVSEITPKATEQRRMIDQVHDLWKT